MPSKIEYVDESWNVVTGCTKVSPGCENCYAERMARRLAGRFGYPEAPHHFDVTLHPDRLDEPLRRKKPTRYLVCSMGDLFHEDVLMETIFDVWFVMEKAKHHTFLVLTKRPDRSRGFFDEWMFDDPSVGLFSPGVLPNVWLGVTVESQDEMWRVEELLKIPAAKHWVSAEPCLGPLDFHLGKAVCYCQRSLHKGGGPSVEPDFRDHWRRCPECGKERNIVNLDWVVLGGETGPGARPCHPDWIRKVRDDCVAAGVDFFFKGWGAWAPAGQVPGDTVIKRSTGHLRGPIIKGTPVGYMDFDGTFRDTNELDSFRVPDDWVEVARVGKKAAGRELDGRTWDEMPETGL